MGRPKLLLEVAGQLVIHRVLAALAAAGVAEVHLLARADDEPLRAALRSTTARVHLVDAPTADMRASAERLLEQIAAECRPQPHDAWLLSPADHPTLQPATIRRVLDAGDEQREAIVLPTCLGRRGHPTLFPWPLATAVRDIPAGRGLDWLLQSGHHPVIEVPVDDRGIHANLNTPEDYARLLADWPSRDAHAAP